MLPFQKILCPTDFSGPANLALEAAAEMALQFAAELCLLHVVVPATELGIDAYSRGALSDIERESVDADEQQLRDIIVRQLPSAVKAYPAVRIGHPAEEIVRAARVENADLVVIATHGLTGWRHLVFGSVTEKVIRQASIPVLVIHQPQS